MREITEIEAAIKETTSMLNSRRSALSDYEDEYNSAVKNGDEDLASHWKSQMRSAENRISELEGILADEQAELKSAQEASTSTSTVSGGTSTSTVSGGTSTSTVSGGTSTSTVSGGTSTSTVSGSPVIVYAGGDQVITDYQSGEQIMLGTAPTGAFFGGGNFALTSATGALFIQNANDKIISFTDGAGNPYAKAYAATAAGVIDGRGLAGYEVINGSDLGGDIIYAGDGGSQLWGGNGFDADILTGGGGTDIFIGGRYQGSDVFLNASSADIVNLNDVTLSDIVAVSEAAGVIALAFNTGIVVTVQSSELLSAAVVLADNSAYRFNHVTHSWQGA